MRKFGLAIVGTLCLIGAASEVSAATPDNCKQLDEIVQLDRRKVVRMNERLDYSQIAARLDRLRLSEDLRTNPDTHVDDITLFGGADLDGDGKPDKLYRQCGDDGVPACVTTVTLTRGGGYVADTGAGHLYRLNGRIYAIDVIVGHYGKRYKYNAHIYRVTRTGFQMICR